MPCFSLKFHKLATNARLRPYIQVLNLIILELHACAARAGGAPYLSKSTHPRKFGNHVTVRRLPTDLPSAPQDNQCWLSHF